MRKLLLILMLSTAAVAGEPPRASLFVDKVILYDGEHSSVPFGWIRKSPSPGSVACGHLELYYHWTDPNLRGLFGCRYTVIGIDFTHRALLAFIDLHHYDFDGKFLVGGYPAARYLTSISGSPIDYFNDLQATVPHSTPLQSLAQVMNQLGRSKKGLGQRRYIDGTLQISTKGPLKQDPLYHGLSTLPPRWGFRLDSGEEKYTLQGNADENKRYPVPLEVYEALSKTMGILWGGYEDLKAVSGSEIKTAFKERIAKNAEVISGEIQTAVELMRSKQYHPLELLWFVNQMGDLIAAIDRILESKEGGAPGFIELINENGKY